MQLSTAVDPWENYMVLFFLWPSNLLKCDVKQSIFRLSVASMKPNELQNIKFFCAWRRKERQQVFNAHCVNFEGRIIVHTSSHKQINTEINLNMKYNVS